MIFMRPTSLTDFRKPWGKINEQEGKIILEYILSLRKEEEEKKIKVLVKIKIMTLKSQVIPEMK